MTQRISNKECISLILRQIKKIEDSQLTLLSLNDSGDSARQVEHQCEYRDTKNLFKLRESFLDKMIKVFKDLGEMDSHEVIDVLNNKIKDLETLINSRMSRTTRNQTGELVKDLAHREVELSNLQKQIERIELAKESFAIEYEEWANDNAIYLRAIDDFELPGQESDNTEAAERSKFLVNVILSQIHGFLLKQFVELRNANHLLTENLKNNNSDIETGPEVNEDRETSELRDTLNEVTKFEQLFESMVRSETDLLGLLEQRISNEKCISGHLKGITCLGSEVDEDIARLIECYKELDSREKTIDEQCRDKSSSDQKESRIENMILEISRNLVRQ